MMGLAFAPLGLFFLVGDPTAADIGWEWIWPIAVVVLGLLVRISAGRRLVPEREPALGAAADLTPASDGDVDPEPSEPGPA